MLEALVSMKAVQKGERKQVEDAAIAAAAMLF
jgi:hypothetical protein